MYLIRVEDLNRNFPFAVARELERVVIEQIPELKPDFPSFSSFLFSFRNDAEVCIASFQFRNFGIPTGGEMDESEFTVLRTVIGGARSYEELRSISGLADRFNWDRLLLVADVSEGAIDWHLVVEYLVNWVNDRPVPRAIKINENRVRMAIPTPPQLSLAVVQKAMWVLECEETITQGTAFNLTGYGVVTNEHVVDGTTHLKAFQPNDVTRSYPVRVVKKNAVLDLAIIDIEGAPLSTALEPSINYEANQMDHVAVCGFPNYRRGDSGILSPGMIVGTRMRSGVRRLLTNAGIVGGMSGGPAIGNDNRVIGICVTGADFMQEGRDTEDQSIIPVDALNLLE